MTFLKKIWRVFMWGVFIPLRIIIWPILWYDLRRRRLGKKADEWHPLDHFLTRNNHVVRTFGYFLWEKKAKICIWCFLLWASLFLVIKGVMDVL